MMNVFDYISNDAVHHISTYMSPIDLNNFKIVCKRFNSTINKNDPIRLSSQQKLLKNDIIDTLKHENVYILKMSIYNTNRFFLLYVCRYFKSVLIISKNKQDWLLKLKLYPKYSAPGAKCRGYSTSSGGGAKCRGYNHIKILKNKYKLDFDKYELVISESKIQVPKTTKLILIDYFRAEPNIDPEINFTRPVNIKYGVVVKLDCVSKYNNVLWYGDPLYDLKLSKNQKVIYNHNQTYSIIKNKTSNVDLLVFDGYYFDLILLFYIKCVCKAKNRSRLDIIVIADNWYIDQIKYKLNLVIKYSVYNPDIIEFISKHRLNPNKEMIDYILSIYTPQSSLKYILNQLVLKYNTKSFKRKIYTYDNLYSMTVLDLKLICKNNRIKGYSNKIKGDLIDIILDHTV